MLKKILPPTYLLIALVLVLILHFLFPIRRIILAPWILLGLLPLAGGLALALTGNQIFMKHQTTIQPFKESRVLITDGIYQISRHPMYLGFALILLGVAILLGSISPFFIWITFVLVIDRVFIQGEEQMLTEQFGAEWATYKSKVRRWI